MTDGDINMTDNQLQYLISYGSSEMNTPQKLRMNEQLIRKQPLHIFQDHYQSKRKQSGDTNLDMNQKMSELGTSNQMGDFDNLP